MAEMAWTANTVAVWQDWRYGEFRCFKRTFDGEWLLQRDGAVIFMARDLQSVMAHAERLLAAAPKPAALTQEPKPAEGEK